MISPVAEVIASRNRPFIFATGYGAHGLPEEYRDRPALQKPFQMETLAQVNDAQGRRGSQARATAYLETPPLSAVTRLVSGFGEYAHRVRSSTQRRDRDIARSERREIGALEPALSIGDGALEADPEIGIAAAVARACRRCRKPRLRLPWRVTRTPFTSSGVQAGKLTLITVFFGTPAVDDLAARPGPNFSAVSHSGL